MYHSVYGTAGAVPDDANTVLVGGTGRAADTYPALKLNRSDRTMIMTVKHAGKPDEHVTVRHELVIPVCPECTAQHRGECY